MKLLFARIVKLNWFFVALVCFVLVLPLSQALVSVFSGVLLFVALVEDSWANKWNRFKNRKHLLAVPVIFLIYFVSTLIGLKSNTSFYDVQKTMFFFVFPLAFAFGKEIDSKQKRIVFYAFALSILLASFITIVRWKFSANNINFSVHKASPISHIRFSFQLILIFWFFITLVLSNFSFLRKRTSFVFLALAAYFLLFLLFQQSLTGIIALGSSILFFGFYKLFTINRKYKILFAVVAIATLVIPISYVGSVVNKFYHIETVNKETIELKTKQGNLYTHYFNDKTVENGRYVNLYICPIEMREEWNKVSHIKYDEIGKNGYPISSTLIRYLTSKGLRKDAEGVKSLLPQDVVNVENGMANVIFANKFSIYPRIYQTVWEYYNYTTTGYINHQSFSQRLEFSKAALTIIKKNLWFGVGTGYWKTEFAKAFKENNSHLSESLYASSHNQYLNFMVKFGIVGFLFIMFLLVYPVVKSKRYCDMLFLIFLVFMIFANFSDSNLESHMGSSFFFFFYCFFITTNGNNYLKIGKSQIE